MQWTADDGAGAGFTDGDPWLPVNPAAGAINVADQRDRDDSILAHYRELVALRRETDALVYGVYDLAPGAEDHPRVWAYERTLGDERAVVALNGSVEPTTVRLPRRARSDGARSVAANYPDRAGGVPERLDLEPYEARVWVG
jgi:glycosidase